MWGARYALTLLVVVLVAGCSQSPKHPGTVDANPDASEVVQDGKAVVYILRDEAFAAGHILAIDVTDHGEMPLPAGTSQRWPMPPGRCVIRVVDAPDSQLAMDLEAGERAFVRASVSVTEDGMGGRLTRLSTRRGEQAVTRTRLLARD